MRREEEDVPLPSVFLFLFSLSLSPLLLLHTPLCLLFTPGDGRARPRGRRDDPNGKCTYSNHTGGSEIALMTGGWPLDDAAPRR